MLDLLRRDVFGRAHELARLGQAALRGGLLRQAEVGQVDVHLPAPAVFVREQDVRGLDVPVDEAA
jgi:hypothetical protein